MRRNRLTHTRKTGREDTNRDLMSYLLLSSDPLISSKRNIQKKNTKTSLIFDKYVQYYLVQEEKSDINIYDSFSSLIHSSSENSSADNSGSDCSD